MVLILHGYDLKRDYDAYFGLGKPGTGFGGAAMNASLQQGHSIVAPGVAYYLITAGGSWWRAASSRPPSRCWPASPDRRSRETNEPAGPGGRAKGPFENS
jgi:hypothetical protein